MKPPCNFPGIGGSEGQCAICGESFLLEIILGRRVMVIELDGCPQQLPVHDRCKKLLREGMPWEDLPPGPLRRAYEKAIHENQAPRHDANRDQG